MRDLIARLCLAVLLVGPAGALAAPNSVMIPPDASIDDIVRAATEVRPSARQVAWQELGFTAFVHFGMNTFTDQEWGHGGEDPRQFDPVAFDADQWVRAFRSAGMRGVVLTCKHHDGFCLWPTETTTHSVRASGWRDGRGDVVADVAAACRAHGLKFGIYLSPWDRNCADFGTPRYNDVFRAQLRELLTNYGEIYDVWFDGANCPKDDPALFDWAGHARLVRELQPGACISIMGPDVRWCGNEAGRTRASEWSVVTLGTADDAPADASSDVMGAYFDTDVTKADLGGRDALRGATRLVWWPAVTNTSIRPGWFHHERDDARVKSLEELLDVYFASVGGNTQFLLNVPPDRRGLIHGNDVRRLAELGDVLRATFDHAVSDDATFTGYMQAGEYRFDEPRTVSVIDLREDVVASGQRVEAFRIDTWDGRRWTEIARGTTIGVRRLVRIPPTTALGFRYWIERARAKPTIASFSLHRAPRLLTPPMIARSRDGVVTIAAREPGPVRYTTDGSDPDETSAVYAAPFALVRGGVVKARSFPDADGGRDLGMVATRVFGLAPTDWRIHAVDSDQAPGEAAALAIDGDPNTLWHSRWNPDSPPHPHFIAIDLGAAHDLSGFTYLPRPDAGNGTIVRYDFEVSDDGATWSSVIADGTFANVKNNPVEQVVMFSAPVRARYVKLVGRSEVNGRAWSSAAEIGVIASDE